MTGKSLPAALIAFAAVSLISQLGLSRQSVGEARLYFPGVQPRLFAQLTRSLQAQPEVAPTEPASNEELAQMALIVMGSQPAREAAQKRTGQRAPVKLQIEKESGGAIHLQVRAGSAAAAHDQLEAILDYYADFVKRTPLTRIARTREDLETRLAQNVKALTRLEDELVRSGDVHQRRLGDATLKANPKVMSQIWARRLDEQQKNRALLHKLEKLRGAETTSQLPGSQWLQDWAGKRVYKVPVSAALGARPVGRQDLLKQARLERDYYDALLLHRSLVLQHSFVLTWNELENSRFELIEPIHVFAYRPDPWWSLGLGVVAGCLVAWLIPKWRRWGGRGEF